MALHKFKKFKALEKMDGKSSNAYAYASESLGNASKRKWSIQSINHDNGTAGMSPLRHGSEVGFSSILSGYTMNHPDFQLGSARKS